MRIGLLGGTGDVGEGLALRWAFHSSHEVVVGSREANRARSKAAEYETELDSRGVEVTIEGTANADAAAGADVVVLSVPPDSVVETIDDVADGLEAGAILVSPAVAMERDDAGLHYAPPPAGSVVQAAAAAAPAAVPVVGAYHNLAADRLANLDVELAFDTPVVGDDPDAIATVRALTEDVDGLRALPAGGLANAPEVESLAPLLINVAMHNEGFHDLGVRFE